MQNKTQTSMLCQKSKNPDTGREWYESLSFWCTSICSLVRVLLHVSVLFNDTVSRKMM